MDAPAAQNAEAPFLEVKMIQMPEPFVTVLPEDDDTPYEDIPPLPLGLTFDNNDDDDQLLEVPEDVDQLVPVSTNSTHLFGWMRRITKEPEAIDIPSFGIELSPTDIIFAVNEDRHPNLFGILDPWVFPITGPDMNLKHVRVIYQNDFGRVTRFTQTIGWDPKLVPGHTSRGTAWHYFTSNTSIGCASCGRWFPTKKERAKHLSRQTLFPEWTSCVVLNLMMNRGPCYFCDEYIGPTTDIDIIEAHTSTCQYLRELKWMVNPLHLEDSGLIWEEIKAFPFPGKLRIQELA